MTQRSGSRIATCRDAAKFRLSAVLCAMLLCAAATARSIHEQDRATQQLRHAEVTDGTPHVTRPSSKGRSALPPAIETVDTVRPTHEDTMALQVPAASQGSTTVQPLDAGVTAIDAAAAAAVSMLAEDEQEQHSISSLATGGGPSRRLLMPCYECAPPAPPSSLELVTPDPFPPVLSACMMWHIHASMVSFCGCAYSPTLRRSIVIVWPTWAWSSLCRCGRVRRINNAQSTSHGDAKQATQLCRHSGMQHEASSVASSANK